MPWVRKSSSWIVWVVLCSVTTLSQYARSAEEREWLRDPFEFGSRGAPQVTAGPVLTGILWDTTRPMAVIEGEPVLVGQRVRGWEVLGIYPDHIVLERGSQQVTLTPGDALPSD